MLENVTVMMEPEDDDIRRMIKPIATVPMPKLGKDKPASTFVVFQKNGTASPPIGSFSCMLKFLSKDCDPATGEVDEHGYEDSYQLEAIELGISDYVIGSYAGNFGTLWEEIGPVHEVVEAFQLDSLEHIPGNLFIITSISLDAQIF